MQSSGLISFPTFLLPQTKPTSSSSSSSSSFPLLGNHFKTLTRPDFGSLKVRAATINDGFAKPILDFEMMSFYELLGIPETVCLVEIKRAYKQLARKYHPDVSPPGLVREYTERFIRVKTAYETLSDPTKRAVYDRDMARGQHLAFSESKITHPFGFDHQEREGKSNWRFRWEDQLSELKKRSMYRNQR